MREEKSTARLKGTSSAEVVQVIQTITLVGTGTEDDPNRHLKQFWTLDGKLLATYDPESKPA